MRFDEETLGKLLLKKLKENKNFNEVIRIVKDNSRGKIYLVGGSVTRTLASEIYGGTPKNHDFDFAVDVLIEDLKVPEGWEVSFQKFGNPTFKKNNTEIDIFPLSDHKYIKKNNLEPRIENFLKGVPFSIHALVFDINNEKLIGKPGIEALRTKTFKVHNIDSAREVAIRKKVSINERMMQKAKSMGLEIIPFEE